jgi:hypothetical protein
MCYGVFSREIAPASAFDVCRRNPWFPKLSAFSLAHARHTQFLFRPKSGPGDPGTAEEVLRQRQDVGDALAQGRQLARHDSRNVPSLTCCRRSRWVAAII